MAESEKKRSFIEIKCLSREEQDRIVSEIEAVLARKKAEGVLNERDLREIAEMKLKPLLDIQDVQSVYEDMMYRGKS